MSVVLFFALFSAFQMPELDLPLFNVAVSDSLLSQLPHTNIVAEPIIIRSGPPKFEDAVVRAGGYYRYAFDLYQLNPEHYMERINSNLQALQAQIAQIGDHGGLSAQKRIDKVDSLKHAINSGMPKDSVYSMFVNIDTEIRTLVGEYRPNGVYAYDMGQWMTAMGVRLTFFPGCSDAVCRSLVLSNVNLLIETVEREDSDHWNAVLAAIPPDDLYLTDRIKTLEFISGLPHYPIITEEGIDVLMSKLKVVYSAFNLEFVA